MKRFLPLFDRVLVQRAEAASRSKGGILIPEKAQAKVREAVVVAAGPGARKESDGATVPMAVKVRGKEKQHSFSAVHHTSLSLMSGWRPSAPPRVWRL